jgi:Ca2+/H+ antiporter, TMEM165/GDT1 family
MDLAIAAITFGTIFLVELPDKTFIAALVLSTRYRPLAVWIGVGLAFGVQTVVAVTAGALATLLPDVLIKSVAMLIFLVGAVVLFRTAPAADEEEKEQEEEFAAKATETRTFWRAVTASFLVLFAAEWGDLSQILTANLAAKYEDPAAVFAGSWLALATVAAIAVLGGRVVLRVVPLDWVRRLAATLFGVMAVLTGLEAVGVF